MRRTVIVLCTATIVGGMLHAANAGQPTWTNSPTSGPSPNNTHMVSGTQCFADPMRIEPQGIAINGGPQESNTVGVRLFATDGTTELKGEQYTAESNGTWSGVFEIPAGLAPGTYPLEARCEGFPDNPRTIAPGGFGAPAVLGGILCQVCFDYSPDRSYIVVAEEEDETPAARAVEGEVAFTG